MAYSVRIIGYSKEYRSPILDLEPPWWPAEPLMEDSRFIEKFEGSYYDYDADLTVEEMRALHLKFRVDATTGVYGSEAWQPQIRPILWELDEALSERAEEFSHFHVNVFEWESGLG